MREFLQAFSAASAKFEWNLKNRSLVELKGRTIDVRLGVMSATRGDVDDWDYPPGCKVSRSGPGGRTRGVAAACWHAHGTLYRELFRINPEGKIDTALATYNGEEEFDEKYPMTSNGNPNNRSFAAWMSADDCLCEYNGYGDF